MGFWTLVAFIVTTAIIARVSGSVQEDVNSVAELGRNMNQKFRELFERLDRLELKMDRIIDKDSSGKPGSTGAMSNDGSSEIPKGFTVKPIMSGSNETQIKEHFNEAKRLRGILSELVNVPACQRDVAHVPQPVVTAAVGASQNLTCESNGKPLASCLWTHSANDTRQIIVVDQQVVANEGRTGVDGVDYAGNSGDFEAGKCAINIESITETDFGLWACNLVTANSMVFGGAVHVASANGLAIQEQHSKTTGVQCRDQQTELLAIFRKVFDGEQNCAPCPACDRTATGKLIEAEAKLQRKQNTLEHLAAVLMNPSKQTSPAHVPLTNVTATVNASTTLSCDSGSGAPWSLCFWQQIGDGQRKLVIMDQDVTVPHSAPRSSADGITYVGHADNSSGPCELKIDSVRVQDFGEWTRTCVSQNGSISRGQVQIQQPRQLTGPEMAALMGAGTVVVRGVDWEWGDQDGNPPRKGRALSRVGENTSPGWIRVQWEGGSTNSYRMGDGGKYDLKLV